MNQSLLPPLPDWLPRRSVAEFAAAELMLDGARTNQPMRLAPYQAGVLDAFEMDGVKRVPFLAGTQTGKTTLQLALMGYGIAERPTTMLFVMPFAVGLGGAQDFSKQRLEPLILSSPALRDRVAGRRAAGASRTWSMANYPGGYLALAGAQSSAGLASKPVERLLLDEVDKFEGSIKNEGPPVLLARRRQSTYRRTAKELSTSTPTTTEGQIWREYELGDRCVWLVKCPHCGHEAAMTWGDHELQPGHAEGAHRVRHHGDDLGACMTCGGCGSPWSRYERIQAAAAGRWQPTAEPTKGYRSFYAWRAMSPFGDGLDEAWSDRREADRAAAAGDYMVLREWRQGVLGVPSRSDAEDFPDIVGLRVSVMERAGTVPPPAGLIHTAGVDVQTDRLCVVLMGWTKAGTGWLLERRWYEGSTVDPEDDCWDDALRWLSGHSPAAVDIDSGHYARTVYEVVGRQPKVLAAVKGRDDGPFFHRPYAPDLQFQMVQVAPGETAPVRLSAEHTRRQVPLWMVGVNEGKARLMARLRHRGADDDPKMLHIGGAAWEPKAEDINELISERPVVAFSGRGKRVHAWEVVNAGKANHLLDATVYAYHGFVRRFRPVRRRVATGRRGRR